MPFKPLLNALVERVPGAQGAIIADWEGESVDQVGIMDDYDLKLIGAHKGVILHSMRDVVDRLGDDELKEVVITTKQAQTVIMPVTEDYYLHCWKPGAVFRHYIRKLSKIMVRERASRELFKYSILSRLLMIL
jgi:predicted regulator of Ras-like GTPase activity (Roadblock/LC7/MglB family)